MATDHPLYHQLADEFAAQIQRGELVAGTRLPTVRKLADERGCDPNTVSRAYQLLARRGLVETQGRRGTIVRAVLREAIPYSKSGEPTLHSLGSHDFCLDLLARQVSFAGVSMRTIPVGSTAGLMALASGQTRLAGCHLLNDDGNGYNNDAIARLLPGRGVRLITLVEREQGLIVPRGNPRRLRDVADLVEQEVRIVNRQPGSGTRLLLDRLLLAAGLDAHLIVGYDRVVETHLAVAAAVAAGSADVGFGLRAAAQALELDFVPLTFEQFDLALLAESTDEYWFGPLLEALAAPQFRAGAESLGGYDASHSAWIRSV